MALSPAALMGIYHAMMGVPPQPQSLAASTPTMESLQFQAQLQEMATQAGVSLPGPEQLQAAALQVSLAGAMAAQTVQPVATGHSGPSLQDLLDRPAGIPPNYQILGDFIGQIHAYNEEKGFGFVTCENLRLAGQKKDPFLLRSQLNGCKLGDHIKFKAVINEKDQLQAWELVYIQDGVVERKNAGAKRTADAAGLPEAGAEAGYKSWKDEKWTNAAEAPADEKEKWKQSGWSDNGVKIADAMGINLAAQPQLVADADEPFVPMTQEEKKWAQSGWKPLNNWDDSKPWDLNAAKASGWEELPGWQDNPDWSKSKDEQL